MLLTLEKIAASIQRANDVEGQRCARLRAALRGSPPTHEERNRYFIIEVWEGKGCPYCIVKGSACK
jgi:hypothetical protein